MTNLGALGGIESLAFAINNRAQAVGEFTFVDSDGTGISHAFRWQGGLMQDLGTVTGDQASIPLPSTTMSSARFRSCSVVGVLECTVPSIRLSENWA